MYDIEKYYNAKTVSEAVSLLKEHPDARIISGGSDVLIKIREGRMAGTSLVSIRDVEEIKGITRNEDGDILIGAGTVFSHITADPIIQKYIPVLGEAVDQVGGPQIRNIGTIGGNICNGAVSADSVPTVFSYNSLLHIANEDGGRIAPVREFYLGPGRVDLHPGEVLTHVIIPKKECWIRRTSKQVLWKWMIRWVHMETKLLENRRQFRVHRQFVMQCFMQPVLHLMKIR